MAESLAPDQTPASQSAATIDPPAADTAEKARQRRKALQERQQHQQALRAEKAANLQELTAKHQADTTMMESKVSAVIVS
jgi:hypothetical protein